MLILGIDTAAAPCCAAVYDTDKQQTLGSFVINNKLTHSVTLMPVVIDLLRNSGITTEDIDLFAVANGPGSFTGLRIGISAVKGMAFAASKPCAAVSTLEAMACNLPPIGEFTICAVMDARCKQFYNALFKVQNGEITRLCDDRAIMVDKLGEELKNISGDIVLVGDGSLLAFSMLADNNNVKLPPDNLRFQKASSVAAAAIKKYNNNETVSAAALMPSYLRLSQAERELIAKNKGEKK